MVEVVVSNHAYLRLRERYPQFNGLSRRDLEAKLRAGLASEYVTLATTAGHRRIVIIPIGAHTVYASIANEVSGDTTRLTVITILTQEMAATTAEKYTASKVSLPCSPSRIKSGRRYRRKKRGWEEDEEEE